MASQHAECNAVSALELKYSLEPVNQDSRVLRGLASDNCVHSVIQRQLAHTIAMTSHFRNHNDVTTCISLDTRQKVIDECQGRSSCEVPATNQFFGDPCRGTYKYLDVAFECSCPAGGSSLQNTSQSLVHVYFEAFQPYLLFVLAPEPEAPAAGECVDSPRHETVCENKGSVSLDCGNGVIDVVSASYGRTKPTTRCVLTEGALAVQTTFRAKFYSRFLVLLRRNHRNRVDCLNLDTRQKVVDACQNKNKCEIPANNRFFGDPCRGTYKYLDVVYECSCPVEPGEITATHFSASMSPVHVCVKKHAFDAPS